MKIIILGNFPTCGICEQLGINSMHKEGWVEKYLINLQMNNDIFYIFPQDIVKESISGEWRNIKYAGFYRGVKPIWRYSNILKERIKEVVEGIGEFNIVHIMGTEYGHTLAMIKYLEEINKLEKGIISVQGMISICAYHYCAGIPCKNVYGWTLGDIRKKSNIYMAKKFFELRGYNETKAIKLCKNIIGRTDFDYACTQQINNKSKYYICGEILRDSFYEKYWSIASCRRNTIFVSQGNYPVKGLHFLIRALEVIKQQIPDIEVRVTGKNILEAKNLNSYEKYLKNLILKYACEKNVKFLGILSEKEMAKEYLDANVFVSPSVVENSSNSIGEAMLIGTPIVASDVGGTNSLISHGNNGYLYPYDAFYMLAFYILKILNDDQVANYIAQNELVRGAEKYNPQRIINDLENIYKRVNEGESKSEGIS